MSTVVAKIVNGVNQSSQALTGSYHIVRVSASGTDGKTVSLYDGKDGKTQTVPVEVEFNNSARITRATSANDCASISRSYQYPGVAVSGTTKVSGTMTKQPMATVLNGTAAMDVDLITMEGLWVEAEGATVDSVVTIEYYPNLPKGY